MNQVDASSTERLFALAEQVQGFMPADEGRALHDAALRYLDGGVGRRDRHLLRQVHPVAGGSGAANRQRAVHDRPPSRLGGTPARLGVSRRVTGRRGHRPVRHAAHIPAHARRGRVGRPRRRHRGQVTDRGQGLADAAATLVHRRRSQRSRRQQDFDGWAKWVAVGGALLIHDVFPDPRDGGRPPYLIYCRAIDSGQFREVSATGSLRVLERISAQ